MDAFMIKNVTSAARAGKTMPSPVLIKPASLVDSRFVLAVSQYDKTGHSFVDLICIR
jgi:hypothetical protein